MHSQWYRQSLRRLAIRSMSAVVVSRLGPPFLPHWAKEPPGTSGAGLSIPKRFAEVRVGSRAASHNQFSAWWPDQTGPPSPLTINLRVWRMVMG